MGVGDVMVDDRTKEIDTKDIGPDSTGAAFTYQQAYNV